MGLQAQKPEAVGQRAQKPGAVGLRAPVAALREDLEQEKVGRQAGGGD